MISPQVQCLFTFENMMIVRKSEKSTRTDKVAGQRKQESVGSESKTHENSTWKIDKQAKFTT